jgi:hypothetical protein
MSTQDATVVPVSTPTDGTAAAVADAAAKPHDVGRVTPDPPIGPPAVTPPSGAPPAVAPPPVPPPPVALPAKDDAAATRHGTQRDGAREELGWQRRLVPFMVGMIAACMLSFISFGAFQLHYIDQNVETQPAAQTIALDQMQPMERPFYALEADLLARRYHQANALLLARTTVQYLGFMTGMLLSLIGAAFVLGKLREGQTEIRGTGPGGAALSIASASPGLVLSTLGVVVMLTTVVTNHAIAMTDHAVYLSSAESSDDLDPEPDGDEKSETPQTAVPPTAAASSARPAAAASASVAPSPPPPLPSPTTPPTLGSGHSGSGKRMSKLRLRGDDDEQEGQWSSHVRGKVRHMQINHQRSPDIDPSLWGHIPTESHGHV